MDASICGCICRARLLLLLLLLVPPPQRGRGRHSCATCRQRRLQEQLPTRTVCWRVVHKTTHLQS
jgi:hypothetical protein